MEENEVPAYVAERAQKLKLAMDAVDAIFNDGPEKTMRIGLVAYSVEGGQLHPISTMYADNHVAMAAVTMVAASDWAGEDAEAVAKLVEMMMETRQKVGTIDINTPSSSH